MKAVSIRLIAVSIALGSLPLSLVLLGIGCGPAPRPVRPPPAISSQGLLALPTPPWGVGFDPVALLKEAMALQDAGEYEQARERYQAIVTLASNGPEAAEARYHLGVIAYTLQEYKSAVTAFSQFRVRHQGHPRASLALFWLAEAHRHLGAGAEALAAYEEFLQRHPQVEAYVRARRAEVLLQDSAMAAAASRELEAAGAAEGAPPDARRRYADSLMTQGQARRAAAVYGELSEAATGWSQSELRYLTAQALRAAGDSSYGPLLAQIVRDHPSSYYAKLALEAAATVPGLGITPYQEGRVRYYQRDDAAALEAFQRHIQALPDHPETPWARYRLVLVFERLNRNDEALQELEAMIRDYPAGEAGEEALWEKGLLLDYLGRYKEASEAYGQFFSRFPASDRARDAGFKEGLSHYRAGDLRAAAEVWAGVPSEPTGNASSGRIALWRGKVLEALGDETGAGKAYAEARESRPGRYYALRAASLGGTDPAAGRDQQGSPAPKPPAGPASAHGRPSANYKPLNEAITPQEDAEVHAWLSGWVASQATPAPAVPQVAAHPQVQRAQLLSEMGLHTEATQEYRAAVRAHEADMRALYALARLLHDRREHAAAIMAASIIWEAAPERSMQQLPRGILEILYPTPYGSLVVPAAREWGIDPLLLYALMRQESLFNPNATSAVSARGLSQVMPATGQDIAARLGVEDFTGDDLYRPGLSIRFGAHYVSRQLEYLGNPLFGLAAYNAGAATALRWMANDKNMDPDLFVETIDYGETAHYVRVVAENYAYYTQLYGGR